MCFCFTHQDNDPLSIMSLIVVSLQLPLMRLTSDVMWSVRIYITYWDLMMEEMTFYRASPFSSIIIHLVLKFELIRWSVFLLHILQYQWNVNATNSVLKWCNCIHSACLSRSRVNLIKATRCTCIIQSNFYQLCSKSVIM